MNEKQEKWQNVTSAHFVAFILHEHTLLDLLDFQFDNQIVYENFFYGIVNDTDFISVSICRAPICQSLRLEGFF